MRDSAINTDAQAVVKSNVLELFQQINDLELF
jgi:hypothetical protein